MIRQSPINFRAFCVIAVAVIGAVMCVYAFIFNRTLGITLGCVYLVGLFALAAVFIVSCVKKRAKLHKTLTFCIAAVLCVVAFVVGVTFYDGWAGNYKYKGEGVVYGRVSCVDTRYGDYKIMLDELTINGDSVDGIMEVKVKRDDANIADFVRCGDRLKFRTYIKPIYLFHKGAVDGTSYRTNIRFTSTVSSDDIAIEFGEPTAIESMLEGMHDCLVENMGEDYGNIAYSMITGDKHGLYSGITDYFSAAGLGHIMAVSGLHVGFVAALINLLLKKANKKVRLGIVTIILLFYTVIADFSPSVIRAVIMTEVYMIAQFVSGRRDILSSLGFSLSVILAVKPLYLFELGFQMSFGAIFGIAVMGNSISRLLTKVKIPKTKIKLPRKVCDAIGTSVSVQAGLIPIEIYHFKTIQTLSLFVNVIFIPYISLIFTCTVVLLPISFIPECGVVLYAAKYLMIPLDYAAMGVASLPYAEITVDATAAAFLCYPVMFVASEFFMMNKGKVSVIIMSVFAYIAFCTLSSSVDGNSVVSSGKSVDAVVYDGKIYCERCTDYRYSADKRIDVVYVTEPYSTAADANTALCGEVEYGTNFRECFFRLNRAPKINHEIVSEFSARESTITLPPSYIISLPPSIMLAPILSG